MTWADAIQNNILRVSFAMLIVQIAGLIGLWRYVVYTRDLKISAEKQIKLSRDLLRAALDQVEGTARPCITLASVLRKREDAMDEVYGVKGISVVKDRDGRMSLRNVGNGLALNISYRFNETGPDRPKDLKGNNGYLQRLHAEREIKLPIATEMTERSTWEVAFEFESLGGRKYRTTLLLEAQVLSNFKFEQISEPRRVISTDKPPDQTV